MVKGVKVTHFESKHQQFCVFSLQKRCISLIYILKLKENKFSPCYKVTTMIKRGDISPRLLLSIVVKSVTYISDIFFTFE